MFCANSNSHNQNDKTEFPAEKRYKKTTTGSAGFSGFTHWKSAVEFQLVILNRRIKRYTLSEFAMELAMRPERIVRLLIDSFEGIIQFRFPNPRRELIERS